MHSHNDDGNNNDSNNGNNHNSNHSSRLTIALTGIWCCILQASCYESWDAEMPKCNFLILILTAKLRLHCYYHSAAQSVSKNRIYYLNSRYLRLFKSKLWICISFHRENRKHVDRIEKVSKPRELSNWNSEKWYSARAASRE